MSAVGLRSSWGKYARHPTRVVRWQDTYENALKAPKYRYANQGFYPFIQRL